MDHAPILIKLERKPTLHRPLWKNNPFWLTLITYHDSLQDQLQHLFEENKRTALPRVLWDTFKAFQSGLLMAEIARIKSVSGEWDKDSAEVV